MMKKELYQIVLLVLLGIMGGERYEHPGGGTNYLCLPHSPKYDKYKDGHQQAGYDTCTALNIKWMITTETLLREIFTIMMRRALSASSSHVVQCWWCLLGMTAHLDGPRSIMGTWWLTVITASIQVTSFVLTGTLSMFLVAMLTRMVLCCTLWKVFVGHSHVFLMSAVESWHAQCVPSDEGPIMSCNVKKE